jgi:hypothetical protein
MKERRFFFGSSWKSKKDDYLCTPLSNKTGPHRRVREEVRGEKKILKLFSQTLVRKENLITFATPKRTTRTREKEVRTAVRF